jgi:hypothetical protein
LTTTDAGIVGKRLELLRETVPAFSRLGVFVVPDDAAADGTLSVLPSAARGLGLDARIYEVRSAAEFEAAFAAALRDGVQALYVAQSPIFLARRAEIVAMAARMRLPAIYFFREFVQAGGLMSYSSDLSDMYRRAATYADKILKGSNPGELPLQSSDKYELAVNLKTAKALGLTISEAFRNGLDRETIGSDCNGCGMADNGHDITMPACLGSKNAKAVLGIMVRDALDETSKNLLRLILGRVFHGRRDIITSCSQAILLRPATRRQRWWRDLASRLKLFQCNIVERRKHTTSDYCVGFRLRLS